MPDSLKVHVLDTGSCLALEATIMRGGRWKVMECPCLVGLIRHPDAGWVLWDTGYSPRMLEVTQQLPYRLYRMLTPLRVTPEQSVMSQLARLGLRPEDIRTIVVSHFHADHLCGLRDFPETRFVATRAGWESTIGRTGVRALRQAYIPALMPDDFAGRVDLLPEFNGPALGALGATHDLFGDGSARLVALPGHAPGQIGMLTQTERGPLLFTADAAWLRAAIRERRPPHPSTHLFVDNPATARDTLERLHQFHREYPNVTLVPTHCPEARLALAEAY